jgi:uridylate kinase
MADVTIISLGGSIISPDDVDVEFLKGFKKSMEEYLKASDERKLILVTGGGAPARKYQKAYRSVVDTAYDEDQDWIGIAATRINAQLLKGIFHDFCQDEVVINPEAAESFKGRVLVAAGWKPGFSTDYDAVLLAEKFSADTLINLSNIEKVYTDDPKTNPEAEPLDAISWSDFRAMVGEEWTPGRNVPFDPVAAKHASEIRLRVIVASGRDIENLNAILDEGRFQGTIIGPE